MIDHTTRTLAREADAGDALARVELLAARARAGAIPELRLLLAAQLGDPDAGLLVSEVDLNHCRQVRDSWGFAMTARFAEYAKFLTDASQPGWTPQIIGK